MSDLKSIARAWWGDVLGRDTGRGRAVRAALRRAEGTVDAIAIPEFHDLYQQLRTAGHDFRSRPDRLALAAIALANLREDAPESAARRMGGAGADRAPVSALRFQRLVRLRAPAELLRPLRRALAQIDHRANVAGLAGDLLWWGERVRRDWCFDYYGAARPEAEKEDVA